MISMALSCRPKLLIADEPTTALDVTVQAEILQLIKTLQDEEKMGVLFITHDMGVVAEIADRTVVMFRSRALEAGKTEEVFARPGHAYTQALLSAVPRLGSMDGQSNPATFALTDVETAASQPEREMKGAGEKTVLDVRNLVTRFDIRSGIFARVKARVMPSKMFPSISRKVKRSRWWVNQAAASRRPAARSCGLSNRRADRSASTVRMFAAWAVRTSCAGASTCR